MKSFIITLSICIFLLIAAVTIMVFDSRNIDVAINLIYVAEIAYLVYLAWLIWSLYRCLR